MVIRYSLCFLLISCCTHSWTDASELEAESEIRRVGKEYVETFNRGDAQGVAAYCSTDAVFIDRTSGRQLKGRDEIAKQFAELFASDGQEVIEVNVESIEFVSPNVAVEVGTSKLVLPNLPPEESKYSAVYVRQDGKWLLDRVTEEATVSTSSNYEHLKELEWVIGSWMDADDNVRIDTTCVWTKNRNFITRAFAVSVDGEVDLSGMQFIGWDAEEKRIRSWTFDSDGGFSHGDWSRSGNVWYVQKSGKTPDGKITTAVNQLKVVDDDSFELQSTQRTFDGELLPNVNEVLVVRK